MSTAEVSTSPLLQLRRCGQSAWLDNFRRGWILSGDLQRMIRDYGISGVTVNPTIFAHAISATDDYDDDIRRLAAHDMDTQAIYEELMVHDIRMAADLFRPIYEETDGRDGFVSIELPPGIAYDAVRSVTEAHRFLQLISRENIMIKVPGTAQGVSAVEELTYDGINVNITLLFSIESYEAVAFAYIRGLERRLLDGEPVNNVASVASFFVSRIDTEVDRQLAALIERFPNKHTEIESLMGKAAIANAKLAYQRFKEIFSESRFAELRSHGARPQKVLWASTSTKSPRYPDTYYVDALIGPETVNTLPTQTIFAFNDHGTARVTLEEDVAEAEDTMQHLGRVGIDFSAITRDLQDKGVKLFQKSVDDMTECLDAKISAFRRAPERREMLHIGDYQSRVDRALRTLSRIAFSTRLWEKDITLWRQGPENESVIKNRLGWLNIVDTMNGCTGEIESFVGDVRVAGFTHAVLLGMGGSSLSPEVSRLAFGVKGGYLDLMVLDTTVPAAIHDVEHRIDPATTLFIVSSKSGATVETLSGYKHFREKVEAVRGDRAGENFIAITDEGTPLVNMARDQGFRHLFINPGDIGGRYSALSYFGIVPAAIIGVDIRPLLAKASRMIEASVACVTPTDNAGMILGAVLGELALEGRDKVTVIASREIESFGLWVEQLLAESTGKNGTGLIPVVGEPLGNPESYGPDRLFIYIRSESSDNRGSDEGIDALRRADQPVVQIRVDGPYDLGQEYFRWEVATATAGAILGVNPFDEPNVKESKDNTSRLLDVFRENGRLPGEPIVADARGIKLYCDAGYKGALDRIRAAGRYVDNTLVSYVAAHFDQHQPGNYIALMAFVEQSARADGIFSCMRGQIRDSLNAATTFGYGPRFLHSTGQLHKGGPNSGIFIQFTADDADDVAIPGEPYTFSVLKQAQAMGDAASLCGKGRPLIRLHIGADVADGLNRALDIIHEAIGNRER